MIEVRRYQTDLSALWNDFLEISKNGLFIFNRKFQDYHSDRFIDHSLIFLKEGKVVGIFPANEKDSTIYSHQGLTFGGIVTASDLKSHEFKEIFDAMVNHLKINNFQALVYKTKPFIFSSIPSQEDSFFLFQSGAQLIKREMSSVINLKMILNWSNLRKRMLKKANSANVVVQEGFEIQSFYDVLTEALLRHNAKPTHSLVELQKLKNLFPDKIKIFTGSRDGEVLAGVLIFDYGEVVHTQYLASSAVGKEVGALDLVIEHIIEHYNFKNYLSFGTSTIDDRGAYNDGLLLQKEGFGARSITLDCYKLALN